jgi:hypothetical protein
VNWNLERVVSPVQTVLGANVSKIII